MADQANSNLFSQSANPAPAAPDPTQQAQPPQQTQAPATPSVPAELAGLVGEGHKYATLEAALHSIAPAQQHISEIEADNAALRQQIADMQAKLDKAANLEEVLKKFETVQQPPQGTTTPTGLDEAGVLKLLEQREMARKAAANQEQVTSALVAKFGDATKAMEALKAKSEELGVDFGYMQDLAAKSPKAILAYFGTQAAPTSTFTQSTVNVNGVPAAQEYHTKVSPTSSTKDLLAAFRECGRAVNGGSEIDHNALGY